MYTTIWAKILINIDIHGEGMSDMCAFSPASFGSCIAKLQMCLEETNMDTPYLFNRMVAMFLYADNVVMLFHHD